MSVLFLVGQIRLDIVSEYIRHWLRESVRFCAQIAGVPTRAVLKQPIVGDGLSSFADRQNHHVCELLRVAFQ